MTTLYTYRALVTKVYDGDTVTVDIDLGFGIWLRSQSIRLLGINTPEVRGDEKAAGVIARDALAAVVLDKWVVIRTEKDKKGKYGRWLAELFYQGESVNEWLINERLAERYVP